MLMQKRAEDNRKVLFIIFPTTVPENGGSPAAYNALCSGFRCARDNLESDASRNHGWRDNNQCCDATGARTRAPEARRAGRPASQCARGRYVLSVRHAPIENHIRRPRRQAWCGSARAWSLPRSIADARPKVSASSRSKPMRSAKIAAQSVRTGARLMPKMSDDDPTGGIRFRAR